MGNMKVNSGFKEETGVEEFQSEVLELSFFLVIQKVKCWISNFVLMMERILYMESPTPKRPEEVACQSQNSTSFWQTKPWLSQPHDLNNVKLQINISNNKLLKLSEPPYYSFLENEDK